MGKATVGYRYGDLLRLRRYTHSPVPIQARFLQLIVVGIRV